MKPRRLIKSITISSRTNNLKQTVENRWLTTLWTRKLPSATIPVRPAGGQASTLARHHLPSSLHRQRRRAARVQIGLASRHTATTAAAADRSHRDRHVEAVDKTDVVVVEGRIRRPEGHLDDGRRRFAAGTGAAEESGAVSGLARAFFGFGVEAAALPWPDSA